MAGLVVAASGLQGFSLFAASVAAAYVDQAFIYPALFGTDDPEIPEVADVAVTGANEGGQIAMCIGPQVRVPMSIIWARNDPIIVYNEDSTGKGGGGSSVTTLSYFTHVTYGVCRAPVERLGIFPDGIDSISHVWLDGKNIYDATQDSALVVSSATGCSVERKVTTFSQFQVLHEYVYRLLMPAGLTDDFTHLQTGYNVTIAGFEDSDYNGTYTVQWTGINQSTGFLTLVVKIGINNTAGGNGTSGANGIATGTSATFDQNVHEWSSDDALTVSIRKGDRLQSVPGWEEDQEGFGNVPAYRGMACVSFERLALARYGNRIPTGHALVKAHADDLTVGQAIRIIILSFTDLVDADIDTSDVEDLTFRGYAIQGRQAARQMLQPILFAYDIIMSEVDDQIIFMKRINTPQVAINELNLGARGNGGEYVTPVAVTDTGDLKIPDRVIVKYFDPDNNWQQGATSERLPNSGTSSKGGEVVEINLNLTLTESEARQIARRVLFDPVTSQRKLRITLMPSEVFVSEGTLVSFTVDGFDWLMLVEKCDRGDDYSYQLEGTVEYQHLREFPLTDTELGGAATNTGVPYAPPQMLSQVFNAPARVVSEGIVPTLTSATAALFTQSPWRGAVLQKNNPQGGTEYGTFHQHPQEAVMGTLLTDFPPISNSNVINYNTTVDVEVVEGELVSVTLQQFLDGANVAYIGGELVSYQNAVLMNVDDVEFYRLSVFRRGLGNTADVGQFGATAGNLFIKDDGALTSTEISAGIIGETHNFRFVASGGDEDFADISTLEMTGRNAIYWEQSNLRGQRASAEATTNEPAGFHVIIKWDRTSRIRGPLFEDAPDFEGSHLYRIRIYETTNYSGTKFVDTIISLNPTDATEYVYSQSAQENDGTFGSQFSVVVNRVGDYGHGPDTLAVLPNQ